MYTWYVCLVTWLAYTRQAVTQGVRSGKCTSNGSAAIFTIVGGAWILKLRTLYLDMCALCRDT